MIEIETFGDSGSWADACAARLAETLSQAVASAGQALFAGAGGSTPSPIYRRLAQTDLDWSRIAVTLVDERYVGEESDQSNARLMRQTLLTDQAASATFIPLYRPAVTVDRAAAEAGKALRSRADRIDAALLGMGEDGHICSMFPNSPKLKTLLMPNLKHAVLGVPHGRDGMAPSLERLSINLPWLIGAGRVVLALKGKTKREVFECEAGGDPAIQPIAALIAHKVPLEVLWTEAD